MHTVTIFFHHSHRDVIPVEVVLAGPAALIYTGLMLCSFVASITLQPRLRLYPSTSISLAGLICFRGYQALVAAVPVASTRS